MKNIAPIPYVFQSNVIAERVAEHRKNIGCFKKLRIELNNIGKTVQSFFAKKTCGWVANPRDVSKMDLRELPRYAVAPEKETAVRQARAFDQQRNDAIASFRQLAEKSAAKIKKGVLTPVETSASSSQTDIYTEAVTHEERHEGMNEYIHYAFIEYQRDLNTEASIGPHDQMEEAFRAHFSIALAPLTFNERHGAEFRKAMMSPEACISQMLIRNAAGVPGMSDADISNQCIHSFRQARIDMFYQALRTDPALLAQAGPHASKAAAKYDADFDDMWMDKHGMGYKPNLQNLLMRVHKTSIFDTPENLGYSSSLLNKVNEKLDAFMSAPVLLSKMAAHAVRAIQAHRPGTKIDGVAAPSSPTSSSPSNAKNRSSNADAYADLFVADRDPVDDFCLEFKEAMEEVTENHQEIFRKVLKLDDSVPAGDIATMLAKTYTKHLLDEFIGFRMGDGKDLPAAQLLRMAHGLAIPTIFNRTGLRDAPFQELNKRLDDMTGNGHYGEIATKWMRLNRPQETLHYW